MADSKGKYKLAPLLWRQLLWKVALIAFVLLILSQIGYIWYRGSSETDSAFSEGRRFLITLETDQIEGKIISSKDGEIVPAKPEEQAPKPEEKASEEIKKEETTEPTAAESKPEPAPAPPAEPEPEILKTIDTITEEKEVELPPIAPSTSPPAELSDTVSEKTEYGVLPKISETGVKPWKFYSKPIILKDKKPMIAIIVTGLGQNKYISEQALRLPEPINLSFSPYARDLNSWLLSARMSGHEVLIDLPMEASNYPVSDPGPLGLLVSKDQAENEVKMKKLMAQNAGYVGFLSPQDEAFIENTELFKSLLQIFAGRGLMLVVGKQPAKNETKEMIEKGNTASIVADTLIDEELIPSGIQARLSVLEQTAKEKGYAIGIANAYPITIKELNEWSAKVSEKGFMIVPVSTIVSKFY